VREVTFTFFFLCVTAGLGLEMMSRTMSRRRSLFAIVFALTLLDSGPLALQPWTRSDLVRLALAGEYLADRSENARVIEVDSVAGKPFVSDDPSMTPLGYGRLQILMGPHKQDATKAHNGFAALLKIVQQDLQTDRTLDAATRTMLAAVNVGWIVGINGTDMGLPDGITGVLSDSVLGPYLRIPEATPYLVSGRLQTMERPPSFGAAPFWDFYFDRRLDVAAAAMAAMVSINSGMHPDPASRQTSAILVPVRPTALGWNAEQEGPTPASRLLSYTVEPDTVRLSVEADRDGFIRLAHPLGLGVAVDQNGRSVTPLADVQSLIVLPLHAGRNDFLVTSRPSALRRGCFWMTVVILTVLSLMAVVRGVWRLRRVYDHGA
jgi:hypothetical protein